MASRASQISIREGTNVLGQELTFGWGENGSAVMCRWARHCPRSCTRHFIGIDAVKPLKQVRVRGRPTALARSGLQARQGLARQVVDAVRCQGLPHSSCRCFATICSPNQPEKLKGLIGPCPLRRKSHLAETQKKGMCKRA
jgi:hypothetical protein